MKFLVCLVLLITSTFSSADTEDQFLVITHHPEELIDIYPHVEIIKSQGRTLLVKAKPGHNLPSAIMPHLRKVLPGEVSNYVPKFKKNLDADPEILKLVNEVTVEQMKAYVAKVSSFGKRSAGSEDNLAASKYIEKEMQAMGLRTEFDCFKKNTCNVYGHLTGTTKPDDIILIEAHLDSVGHMNAGADDNASGIAGLLMIAKKVIQTNPKTSFIFFATNGEENGLLGAKHYAKKLAKSGELEKVKFVINMDMIGYNATSTKIDLETNKKYVKDAEWMAELVNAYTYLTPNIVTPAWGSDHVPFLKKKIPTVLTIEHWQSKTPCYHSRCDLAESLTYEYGLEIIKLNIAAAHFKSEEN